VGARRYCHARVGDGAGHSPDTGTARRKMPPVAEFGPTPSTTPSPVIDILSIVYTLYRAIEHKLYHNNYYTILPICLVFSRYCWCCVHISVVECTRHVVYFIFMSVECTLYENRGTQVWRSPPPCYFLQWLRRVPINFCRTTWRLHHCM